MLLNRVKWFDGPSSPTDNHSWFVFFQDNEELPTIRYISKEEGDANEKSWALTLGFTAAL